MVFVRIRIPGHEILKNICSSKTAHFAQNSPEASFPTRRRCFGNRLIWKKAFTLLVARSIRNWAVLGSNPVPSGYLSVNMEFTRSCSRSTQPGPRGSKIVPVEMTSPHSYSTSILTIGLSCTVKPQYTTWQIDDTDRVIGIGRLCCGIGGLIIQS